MDGIAIEMWTMDENYSFDNFYVGRSLEGAYEFADSTWSVKYKQENALEEERNNPHGITMEDIYKLMKENSSVVLIVGFGFVGIFIFIVVFVFRTDPPSDIDKKSDDHSNSNTEEKPNEGEVIPNEDKNHSNIRKRTKPPKEN